GTVPWLGRIRLRRGEHRLEEEPLAVAGKRLDLRVAAQVAARLRAVEDVDPAGREARLAHRAARERQDRRAAGSAADEHHGARAASGRADGAGRSPGAAAP